MTFATFRSSRWFLFGFTLGGWLFYGWVHNMIITNAGMIDDGDALFVMHDLMDDAVLPAIILVPLTLVTIVSFCVGEAVDAHKSGRK